MNEELIEKYLGSSQAMTDVLNAYRNIRFELKKMGHTEKSAQKVTKITPILGLNQTAFQYYLKQLKEEMSDLFNLDENTINFIVSQKLEKINSIIPLNDGD